MGIKRPIGQTQIFPMLGSLEGLSEEIDQAQETLNALAEDASSSAFASATSANVSAAWAQAAEDVVTADLGTTDGQTRALLENDSSQTTAAARALVAGDIADPESDVGAALTASYAAKDAVPTDLNSVSADGALTIGRATRVDASGAARTMTLADGTTKGQIATVEKYDSSVNTVTITGKIRSTGAGSFSLAYQYETIQFTWMGTFWEPTAGHRTKASLDAALLPRAITGPGGSTVTRLVKVTPNDTTQPPFEFIQKEFANAAHSPAWPRNVGVWFGHNASMFAQDGSGDAAKHRSMLGMESWYGDPNDSTFAPELYYEVGTAANAITTKRPFYIRPILNTIAAGDLPLDDQYTFVLIDIGKGSATGPGTAGGVFVVSPGPASANAPLLLVDKTKIMLSAPSVVADGTSFAVRPNGGAVANVGALFLIDSKGTAGAEQSFQINAAAAWGFKVSTVNLFEMLDKSARTHLSHTYGASSAAAFTNINANLVVAGALRATGTGFGVNGNTPSGKIGAGAAATDLATVISLANNLRIALQTVGICS